MQHSLPLPLRFSTPHLPHSEHTAEVVSGGVVNPLEMKGCLGARWSPAELCAASMEISMAVFLSSAFLE